MALRNAQALTFQGAGVSDTIDGTNAALGALSCCTNLVPNPSTAATFVPRPAAVQVVDFVVDPGLLTTEGGSVLTTEGGVEISLEATVGIYTVVTALIVIGTRAYGMAGSVAMPGRDVPFCYDLVANTLIPIGNITAANTPASPPATGDWVPPQLEMIANRLVVTHPGFDGVTHFVGWIDVRNFSLSTLTGNTHSSTLIDGLSSNPLLLDIQPGDLVSGPGVPAGTYVVNTSSTSVTLSQAATATASGVALAFSSGSTGAPVWGSGNTSGGLQLPAVPVGVQQFNGRAYYAVGNSLVFSDSLIPLQCTNATQVLVLGDSTPVTAVGGLPLGNQVVGGVVQSIIAFKGSQIYYQITGDASVAVGSAGALAVQAVAGSVGTIAPNSLSPTPLGLAYIAPDGLRIIGLDGKSSAPLGADGMGVAVPFIFAVNSTRINAAYAQNVLRISVQNGAVSGQPAQEWWYHLTRGIWTGPHSFPAAMISPYQNGAIDTFIMAPVGVIGSLWRSDAVPALDSTYVENGVSLAYRYCTALLPDNGRAAMNQVVESSQSLAIPTGTAINILALDEAGLSLGTVTLGGGGGGGTTWGGFTWGSFPWGAAVGPFKQQRHPWPTPLVFKQMQICVTGVSAPGLVIGNIYAKYQVLGYML